MQQPLTRNGIAACAICRKQLARRKQAAESKSGLLCHPWCLQKATKAGSSTTKAVSKPAPQAPARHVLPTSPFAKQQPERLPDCPVCGLPRNPTDQLTETADGWAHLACVEGDLKPSKPGTKAFAKNKERIESGVTFAGKNGRR